jgi:hypothetical protein
MDFLKKLAIGIFGFFTLAYIFFALYAIAGVINFLLNDNSDGWVSIDAEEIQEIDEEIVVVEETVFNVDGVTCWVGNHPVITYDTSDHTVKMNITCGVEVLDHHLPAIERTQ